MSGGSYDYACYKVDDMAESIRGVNEDPRRAAFQKLLKLVALAMHDIEWVDSYDYSKEKDHKAIDEVFAFLGKDPDIIKKAAAYDKLKDTLKIFFKETKDYQTPEEKAELAYQQQQRMLDLNRKICETGTCVHKEHQKDEK